MKAKKRSCNVFDCDKSTWVNFNSMVNENLRSCGRFKKMLPIIHVLCANCVCSVFYSLQKVRSINHFLSMIFTSQFLMLAAYEIERRTNTRTVCIRCQHRVIAKGNKVAMIGWAVPCNAQRIFEQCSLVSESLINVIFRWGASTLLCYVRTKYSINKHQQSVPSTKVVFTGLSFLLCCVMTGYSNTSISCL